MIQVLTKAFDHYMGIPFDQFKEKLISAIALFELIDNYDNDIKKELDFIEENTHKNISKYFCSDIGSTLMNKDSKIIFDTVMYFTNKNITCLPIHDSIIIPRQYKDELNEKMQKNYSLHMGGFYCNVDEK